MKRLLIDLNSIVSAALLVGRDADAISVDGEDIPTAGFAVRNFTAMLSNALGAAAVRPFQVVGVFDAPYARKRRQAVYRAYKEHRKPRPAAYYAEFNTALDTVKVMIRSLGGVCCSAAQTEADDLICFISKRVDCVIWTKDKDMLGYGSPVLLGDRIYSGPTCEDKFFNVAREHVPVVRTLLSDPGDFGPGMGVKGFGEKALTKFRAMFGDDGLTALAEMFETGDFQSLFDSLSDMPELKKIIDAGQTARLTWALCKPLSVRLHDIKWEPGYVREYADDAEYAASKLSPYYQRKILVTSSNFPVVCGMIESDVRQSEFVALDIETDVYEESLNWINNINANVRKGAVTVDVIGSVLVGLSLTAGANHNHTYYITIRHDCEHNLDSDTVRDWLLPLLESVTVVAHNASGFELPVLLREWGELVPNMCCSKIAASYVDENSPQGLKSLSKKWYDYDQVAYSDVCGEKGMSELTPQRVFDYGCDDTIMTSGLFSFFVLVMQVESTWDAYCAVETSSMYATAMAFAGGFNPDIQALEQLESVDSRTYTEELDKIKSFLLSIDYPGSKFVPLVDLSPSEIKRGYECLTGKPLKSRARKVDKLAAEIGGDYGAAILTNELDQVNSLLQDRFVPRIGFDPASPKDVTTLVYTYLGCPATFSTDKGNPSTEGDALKWAAKFDADKDAAACLASVIACRAVLTRRSLYYDKYRHFVHWQTGQIHSSLKQSSTTSRRFAPGNPNVNQLPKRSEFGKQIRRVVVPHKPTALIVAPDESGQELRLYAEVTKDKNFLACYIGDDTKDLHTWVAMMIYTMRYGDVDYSESCAMIRDGVKEAKQCRVDAKATNFLAQYGGSAFSLSYKMTVPLQDAEEFLKAREAAFPDIKLWEAAYDSEMLDTGYSETLLGAKKHIKPLMESGMAMGHILRSGRNFRIQSSAAEMTKLILGSVYAKGLLHRYDCRLYFPAHDEFVFSVDRPCLTEFCYELGPIMTQQYANMVVPLASSLSIGPNFCDLVEMDWPISHEDQQFSAALQRKLGDYCER